MSSFRGRLEIKLAYNEILNPSGGNGVGGPNAMRISELDTFFDALEDSDSGRLVAYLDTQSGVGASQDTDYDLIGSLTDLESQTLNFEEVYWVIVYNRTATYPILIGPHPTTNGFGVLNSNQGFWNAAADKSVVPTNSLRIFHSSAGVPASAGSTDVLRVSTISGSSANGFSVLIIGRDNG